MKVASNMLNVKWSQSAPFWQYTWSEAQVQLVSQIWHRLPSFILLKWCFWMMCFRSVEPMEFPTPISANWRLRPARNDVTFVHNMRDSAVSTSCYFQSHNIHGGVQILSFSFYRFTAKLLLSDMRCWPILQRCTAVTCTPQATTDYWSNLLCLSTISSIYNSSFATKLI